MLYSDIRELKTVLDIDPGDTSEDKKINFFLDQASRWIETYLNRPGMSYALRTEYYNGTGTRYLLLKSRPVYITPEPPQVWIDTLGFYGAASGSFASGTQLTWGTAYCLEIDSTTASGVGFSRCGVLLRNRDYWYRPFARQAGLLSPFIVKDFGSIKVQYYAGYTVDDLPGDIRMACNTLVARMMSFWPLGLEMNSEGYEERNISWAGERKDYLMSLVKPLLFPYRNWNFGGPGG